SEREPGGRSTRGAGGRSTRGAGGRPPRSAAGPYPATQDGSWLATCLGQYLHECDRGAGVSARVVAGLAAVADPGAGRRGRTGRLRGLVAVLLARLAVHQVPWPASGRLVGRICPQLAPAAVGQPSPL